MTEWAYFYYRPNAMSVDKREYAGTRFFREDATTGLVEEAQNDGTWSQSEGLEEARALLQKALDGEEFLPDWTPHLSQADEYFFADMFQLVQRFTNRFSKLPPEGLLERPPRGPVQWQYFTLAEEGRLVSIMRRDLGDPDRHNCQALNDNSEWTFSPYLIEYHLGMEHFHELTDITAHEAAVLLRQFESELRNFVAPTEPRLEDEPPPVGARS